MPDKAFVHVGNFRYLVVLLTNQNSINEKIKGKLILESA
jgi:hypothetical protein